MNTTLTEKLSRVPDTPGVYLMKDADGTVIYVGKARSLKKRLASYFKASGPADTKTGVLVGKINTFDTILTATEKEALILEETLIKRHRPRYNVILKDDKRYPSLRLDITHPWPNLTVVRKIRKDGAMYFGPYSSALAVRETLNLINKTFRLRKCKNRDMATRTRPCLHYQMGRCMGPCCLAVDPAAYRGIVQEVVLFLKGRTRELIDRVRQRMATEAGLQNFESAATLRDQMFALEKTLERQVAVTNDFSDRDVLATARSERLTVITVMRVRTGSLVGSRNFDLSPSPADDAEILSSFIRQYYAAIAFIPPSVLVSHLPEDVDLLDRWLSEQKGNRVRLHRPMRGEKVRLMALAGQNAANALKEHTEALRGASALLGRLADRLGMDRPPRRIECVDNSNTAGTAPVSSLVVFVNGRAEKSAYRTYKIRTVAGPDDYATMAEVLQRRFRTGWSGNLPDLLMMDGGRGQLNIAVAVLKEMGLDGAFLVAGIAKKDEARGEPQDRIYLPGRTNPVNFTRDADLLLFLQRIRDEAHRFAIAYHRKLRGRAAVRSALDGIAGIGPKRKTALLKHFGDVEGIRAASVHELEKLPGMNRKLADDLKKALQGSMEPGINRSLPESA